MRYAVIENGVVVNTVLWDGTTAWSPPGLVLPIEDTVSIGFLYADGVFTAPPEPEQE